MNLSEFLTIYKDEMEKEYGETAETLLVNAGRVPYNDGRNAGYLAGLTQALKIANEIRQRGEAPNNKPDKKEMRPPAGAPYEV